MIQNCLALGKSISCRSIFIAFVLMFLMLGAGNNNLASPNHSYSMALAASALEGAYDVEIPILAYHKVDESAPSTWYVTAENFASQMDVLKAYGYQTVSLRDYLEYYNGATPPPEKPVIISFDDGYQGIYDHAYPILADREMQATVFVLTGYTGETEAERYSNVWNPSEPLTYHMIWPEVLALDEAGFSIGSHTVTHPNLLNLTEAEAEYEIASSYQDIYAHIPGSSGMGFAYPYGNGANSSLIRQLVQEAGYSSAVAFGASDGIANPAQSDIWALPRRSIIREISLELDNSDPWYFFMRRLDPDYPLPNIGGSNLAVLDSAGNERDQFYPGETISVTLSAYNWGSPTDVRATLEITNSSSTIYSSHWMSSTEDVSVQPFSNQAQPTNFTYHFSIPHSAEAGVYTYSFNIFDNYYLLNYYREEVIPAFTVVESPISVKANVDALELHGNEPYDIWFTVNNTGSAAEEMYLTVSLSHGLRILSTYPESPWSYYPIGSEVKIKDCSVDCPVSTYAIYEASETDYGIGERTYRLTVQSVTGSTDNEWIHYRLSMRLPEGQLTPDWYLRDPLIGEMDQQGWYAWSIPVAVFRNDIFIPYIIKQ